MKSIITFILFVAALTNVLSQSTPEWRWIHPTPQSQYVNCIRMIDVNTWYAVGDYGMFLKTTNAGATWTTKTAGYQNGAYPGAGIMMNNRTAYFINANTGFLGVQAASGIARTTNGGQTFDTVRILQTGTSTGRDFYFLNPNTGFLCGSAIGSSSFKVMKTTDAGNTWTEVTNSGTLGTLNFYSVYASDENNIKVASVSGNIYITSDAGTSWSTVNVGAAFDLTCIRFLNPNTGYVCGWNGTFRYTTNGGSTWLGNNPSSSSLFNIAATGSEVYVSGYSSTGDVYKSTDNGITWTTLNYSNASTITGFLAFGFDKSGSNMAVTGTYGEMIRSTNNGASWSTMSNRQSLANMNGEIYAQNGTGRIIACGINLDANDDILVSSNGGLNWTTPGLTAGTYFLSIGMVNPTTGYLSGRDGYFFKTTSGGTSWISLSPNPVLGNYWLRSIDFVNESTGWVVGGFPPPAAIVKIFKTTNGGVNWIDQPSAFSPSMGVKVDMVDVNTGYMSYSIGLQKTTNSGSSWNIIPVPPVTNNEYRAMKVIDANTVYIGGTNSEMYFTTNSGSTWDSMNVPVYAGGIFSTDWYDAQNGCYSAVIGVVGKTTNRGQSWQITNNGGYTVFDTKMVHPDTMFSICGNTMGGMVMKYVKSTVGVISYENSIPEKFSLRQSYPNPFNPSATIEFDLPQSVSVTLKIYDITGAEVETLINGLELKAGIFKYQFDGSMLASGVYFYKLITNDYTQTRKMILIK